MREILFRGRTAKDKEWVYGDLLHDGYDYDVAIWEQKCKLVTEIFPETVGQFTGLTDKNGKKIFEGDIVKDHGGVVYPVVFDLTGFYLKYAPPHSHGFHYDLLPLSNYWHAHGAIIEVIGNIHDNPEFLKEA